MPISAVIRQRKPPNDLCVTHGLPTARDYDLETLLRKGYVEAADDQSVSLIFDARPADYLVRLLSESPSNDDTG